MYRTEKRYVRKDRTIIWSMTTVTTVRNQDGKFLHFLAMVEDIAERKRVEEMIRQSHDELETRVDERAAELSRERQLLRTLIDNLPDAVYAKDATSRKTMSNRADLKFLGRRTEAEVIGKNDFDFFPKGQAEKYWADDQRVLRGEPLLNREEFVLDEKGRECWLLTSKLPLRDPDGKIAGLVGIGRNITELKQAEQALRQSHNELEKRVAERTAELAAANDMLQLVRDTIPVRLFWKNKDLVYLGCNSLFAKDAGRESPEAVIGETDYTLCWREQAERYRQDDQEVLDSGKPKLNYEEPQTTPDGKQIWLRTSKVPLRDINNRVIGILGTYEDITERKRAEEALRHEQALMATMMENIPDAIYFKDTASRFIRLNRAQSRTFGLSDPAQIIGKTDFDFSPGERAQEFYQDEQRIIRTGEPLINKTEKQVGRDGKISWTSTTKVQLRDLVGTVIGLAGISRDITESKRAEEALEQGARELQQRNDELMRFTYTASHDLKSPLVTIKAFLGYLEQDTANQDMEATNKDRQYIYTAVDKMTRLLDELLDLARVGHKMNPPEEVPLQVVVKDALDMVAGAVIQKGIEVVATKEPIILYGDRTRLVAVFQNLLDNAIKFMGDQPNPRVEIGVEKPKDGNVFFVRDNGIGIDPRYQPKVFGLFEKYDPGTKGTGIGLALVQRIVEVHGGKIWVESAGIGQGTTFRFTLAKTQTHPDQPKSNEHL